MHPRNILLIDKSFEFLFEGCISGYTDKIFCLQLCEAQKKLKRLLSVLYGGVNAKVVISDSSLT